MAVSRSVLRTVERAIQRTPQRIGGGGPPGYVQNRVSNGGNGLISTGLATWPSSSSNQMTWSMWVEQLSDAPMWFMHYGVGNNPSQERGLIGSRVAAATSPIHYQRGSNNTSDVANVDTDISYVKQERHHILLSTVGANTEIYIDGVLSPYTPAASNFSVLWVQMIRFDIGGLFFSAVPHIMSDFWFESISSLDFSIPENLAKFIDTSGNPVFLGENGELPTGGPPDIFFGSDMLAADWNAGSNRGTGGGTYGVFNGPYTDV